ncbi:MAG TPA: hypothetical protein VK963_00985 [Candidatus Saccharimonadales bacterium]|nr:hypothetical protein [Candidatus Saccharimonadales bacterium]
MSGFKKGLVSTLTVALVGAAAGGSVYAWQQQVLSDYQTTAEGDALLLRAKVADLEKQNGEAAQAKPAEPVVKADSDEAVVTKTVKARVEADAKINAAKTSYKIDKLLPNFARVSVTGAPASAKVVTKKVGDTWVVVYQGARDPSEADKRTYAMPVELFK